jgi:hypothetical protein
VSTTIHVEYLSGDLTCFRQVESGVNHVFYRGDLRLLPTRRKFDAGQRNTSLQFMRDTTEPPKFFDTHLSFAAAKPAESLRSLSAS